MCWGFVGTGSGLTCRSYPVSPLNIQVSLATHGTLHSFGIWQPPSSSVLPTFQASSDVWNLCYSTLAAHGGLWAGHQRGPNSDAVRSKEGLPICHMPTASLWALLRGDVRQPLLGFPYSLRGPMKVLRPSSSFPYFSVIIPRLWSECASFLDRQLFPFIMWLRCIFKELEVTPSKGRENEWERKREWGEPLQIWTDCEKGFGGGATSSS